MATSLMTRTAAREAGYQMMQYISARLTLASADAPVVKVGTLPAGSVIVGISSRVITAITGGTPVLGIDSVTAGGATPAVGSTGNIQGTMAETAGSELVFASTTVAQPFANDVDIYVGTSGAATAGDAVITVMFVKPLS
jgi:hypothetical protein